MTSLMLAHDEASAAVMLKVSVCSLSLSRLENDPRRSPSWPEPPELEGSRPSTARLKAAAPAVVP